MWGTHDLKDTYSIGKARYIYNYAAGRLVPPTWGVRMASTKFLGANCKSPHLDSALFPARALPPVVTLPRTVGRRVPGMRGSPRVLTVNVSL